MPLMRLCSRDGIIWDYQLPVAATLLLRFLLDAPIALLGMLAFAVPAWIDNVSRNHARDACREALNSNGTAQVAFSAASSCAFAGLPIRTSIDCVGRGAWGVGERAWARVGEGEPLACLFVHP